MWKKQKMTKRTNIRIGHQKRNSNRNLAWTLLLSTCLWCVFLRTHAQEHMLLQYHTSAKGGTSVLVENVQVTRQGESTVCLQMLFSLAGVRQPSIYATELTPRLYTATDSIDFPSVRLLGSKAYYHDVRYPDAPDEEVMEYRDREAYQPQAYAKQVPYQAWMSGAKLKFVVRAVDGCGNERGFIQRTYHLPYQQRFTMAERLKIISTQQAQYLQGRAYISFSKKNTKIDPNYQNNPRELARIQNSIDSLLSQQDVIMKHLSLKGFASPEGAYLMNLQLASDRVHSLKQYLMDTYGLEDDIISVDYEPEDWVGLRKYVDGSTLPERNALLTIIDNTQDPDERLKMISQKYPKTYRFLLDSVFVYLRHTDYRIEYVKVTEKEIRSSNVSSDSTTTNTFMTGQMPEGPSIQLTQHRVHRYKPLMAVKTNLLFDAVLVPNVEIEVPLGRRGNWSRWSIMGEMWFPWWRFSHNPDGDVNPYLRPDQRPTRKSLEMLTGGLELRYWMLPRCNGHRPLLSGTFIGLYAAGGKYDLEWNSEGSQGEFISAGITVGHSWTIGRHWNLELSASGGFIHTPYRYYEAEFDDTHLIYRYNKTKNLIAPTKLKLSLVYILGKKGGKK